MDICHLCEERGSEDPNASYEDCSRCGNPTCERHGRTLHGEFFCFDCIEEY